MTNRMYLFADEYISGAHTGKPFVATAAAKYAGYAHPAQYGHKLLRHPDVKEYIQKHLDAHAMEAGEILARFTDIARAEIGDVVTMDDGRLRIDNKEVLNNKKFIKSFGFDSNGNPKIEFHDAMQALRDIARIRGMMKDGLEVSGPGGGAVPVAMSVQFVDPDGSPSDLNEKSPDADDVEEEDFSDIEEYPDG